MDFIDWVEQQIENRQVSKAWVANRATDAQGKDPMDETTLGRLLNRKAGRNLTAGHVIRISRAFRADIMGSLKIAGFVSAQEAEDAQKFKPDNPALFGIWNLLNQLEEEGVRRAEPTILAAINRELEEAARGKPHSAAG